jgi:hypothetical protein
MGADLQLIKKEAKTITFTIKDESGNAIDVSSATLKFCIAADIKSSAIVTINDGNFNKDQAAAGIVSFQLSADNTDRDGNFVGELKTQFSDSNIDKTTPITISIGKTITD